MKKLLFQLDTDAHPAVFDTIVAYGAGYLEKLAAGLVARQEEIAKTISGEVGMPIKMSTMVQASPVRHRLT